MLQRYQDECKLDLTKSLKERSLIHQSPKALLANFQSKRIIPSATLSSTSSSGLECRGTLRLTGHKRLHPTTTLLSFKNDTFQTITNYEQHRMTQKCSGQCLKKSLHTQHPHVHKRKGWVVMDCFPLGRWGFWGLCSFSALLVTYLLQGHPNGTQLLGQPNIITTSYWSLSNLCSRWGKDVYPLHHTLDHFSLILILACSCEIFELMLQEGFDWGTILRLEKMSLASLSFCHSKQRRHS